MRLVLPVLVLASVLPLTAADLTAVRIWPGYRSADSFERISEFFDGQENAGGQTYLRSQPGSREGFYFLTRIKNSSAEPLQNVRVELSVVSPASAEPRIFSAFPAATLPRGSHVVQIGLTGSDWPDAAANPVAWQIRLLSADGQELLREQSYLWSQPSKN